MSRAGCSRGNVCHAGNGLRGGRDEVQAWGGRRGRPEGGWLRRL